MNKFRLRKVAKKLASIGSIVDETYMLEINNESPMTFPSYDDLLGYLKHFRESNIIFNLKIYRINVYSL